VCDRVIVHGMVPSSELDEWAASAHVGLQVQRNVGLNSYYCAPIKIHQYFAVGLPVLAPNFPGMIDLVEKQGLGLCADPESVDAIREGMRRLLFDDAFRGECAANALRLSHAHYCYEVEAADFIETLERLGAKS
jgi:glycosyltransferase involved in cell wall biosynthesis